MPPIGYEMIKQHFFVRYVLHFCNYTTRAHSDTLYPVYLFLAKVFGKTSTSDPVVRLGKLMQQKLFLEIFFSHIMQETRKNGTITHNSCQLTCYRIGVGAGKFLGVRSNFARILPNLPEKYLKISDLQKNKNKNSSCQFGRHVISKALHANSGANIFKSKHVGRHFWSDFQRFCPDFHQIETFGGAVALHPWTPASYTSALSSWIAKYLDISNTFVTCSSTSIAIPSILSLTVSLESGMHSSFWRFCSGPMAAQYPTRPRATW